MLKTLTLRDVGPGPAFGIELTSRLNLVTGDNGLGKTFLLDLAWWALTRTWARLPAAPARHQRAKPSISFTHATSDGQAYKCESTFSRTSQSWSSSVERAPYPGLVIYAQDDGGFSCWDPARNYWKSTGEVRRDLGGRPRAYLLKPQEVWDGLPLDAPSKLCSGLLSDWATWQRERGQRFQQLLSVLKELSPSDDDPMRPGALTRLSLADVRDHPTLQMSHGDEVALLHTSAGMRRMAALAYLLVWTRDEHLRACELFGTEPVGHLTLLVDEVEAHLHPMWQKRVLSAFLKAVATLTGGQEIQTHVIATTHSPENLTSLESTFTADTDAIWELRRDGTRIVAEPMLAINELGLRLSKNGSRYEL